MESRRSSQDLCGSSRLPAKSSMISIGGRRGGSRGYGRQYSTLRATITVCRTVEAIAQLYFFDVRRERLQFRESATIIER